MNSKGFSLIEVMVGAALITMTGLMMGQMIAQNAILQKRMTEKGKAGDDHRLMINRVQTILQHEDLCYKAIGGQNYDDPQLTVFNPNDEKRIVAGRGKTPKDQYSPTDVAIQNLIHYDTIDGRPLYYADLQIVYDINNKVQNAMANYGTEDLALVIQTESKDSKKIIGCFNMLSEKNLCNNLGGEFNRTRKPRCSIRPEIDRTLVTEVTKLVAVSEAGAGVPENLRVIKVKGVGAAAPGTEIPGDKVDLGVHKLCALARVGLDDSAQGGCEVYQEFKEGVGLPGAPKTMEAHWTLRITSQTDEGEELVLDDSKWSCKQQKEGLASAVALDCSGKMVVKRPKNPKVSCEVSCMDVDLMLPDDPNHPGASLSKLRTD